MNAILNTIILDDRESAIKTLIEGLEAYPEVRVIEATTSLAKAKNLFRRIVQICYFSM